MILYLLVVKFVKLLQELLYYLTNKWWWTNEDKEDNIIIFPVAAIKAHMHTKYE